MTSALDAPLRDRRDAALDIARGTLIGVRAGLPDGYERTRRLIAKALARIDELLREPGAEP